MKGLIIAGPTGVGKTALSIKLAKELDAVIISCDSMQVYKGMDVGTAKIREEEMEGVPHFMLDIVWPTEKYSVGSFADEVNKLLEKFEKEDKNVILAGGTGLYIDSIVKGFSNLPEGDEEIRKELKKLSNEELYAILKEVDNESAEKIHINNRVRLERAVEVYRITGEKFSKLSLENLKGNNVEFLYTALERDREHLYERINKRVDIMFDEGLLEEAKWVYENYREGIEKIKAIGYKELFLYFDGTISLEEAKSLIKRESRRYAKRQFTWFKKHEEIKWFNLDHIEENQVKEEILHLFKKQY